MNVTRRGFLQTAGLGASVALATTYSPFSYAQNEKVRVASIGTGGQGSFHLSEGLTRAKSIQMVAVCDVYEPHLEGGWRVAGGGDVKKYMDYREMLEKEQLDAVVIATPLNTHFQIAMDCLDAGKWVFCEKTLCYTIDECRKLVEKSHEVGKFVQVGHQRRYNPEYNQALLLAREEKVLGRINHIDCQWHRNNDWRRAVPNRALTEKERQFIKTDLEHHLNWRLYNATSDGLMTELGAHQFDVANWLLDAMPTRVMGYGSIDYWRDGREVYDNVNTIHEYEITPQSQSYAAPAKLSERMKELGELDGKPYKVRVVYSSITANAMRGASELIQGDKGTFELTEGGCKFYREAAAEVKWADKARKDEADANAIIITSGGSRRLSNKAQKEFNPIVVDMDRSVDQLQFEAFAHDIQTNGTPKANIMVGLKSAICALAATTAMREGREVAIDPAWYTFDFDTPDSTTYSV